MDLLPTLAALAGANPPRDRVIDGRDIRPLLFGEPGAKTPHEAFYYYYRDQLQAVRAGQWKLHLALEAKQVGLTGNTVAAAAVQLYDLENDLAETTNVAADHPQIVARLQQLAEMARADLGDGDRAGANERPAAHLPSPQPQVLPR